MKVENYEKTLEFPIWFIKTQKEAKHQADKIGGIVYKTNRYTFAITKGYPELAVKVLIQHGSPRGTQIDQCNIRNGSWLAV